MFSEGPPVKAVPESVRNRITPQSTLFTAAPESLRSRAPPPPEGTPSQQTETWLGPPVDPPEVNEMELDELGREAAPETRRATRPAQGSAMGLDHGQSLPEFDAVCAWTPKDRVIVKRIQKWVGEFLEFRERLCQDIGVLDDKISAEEMDLLEKKQAMDELLKERRGTDVEVWRDTVVAGSEVAQMATAGLEAPKRRVISFCPKWEYLARGEQAGGKFPRRRRACEDSFELSSFHESPVPGHARCQSEDCRKVGNDVMK